MQHASVISNLISKCSVADSYACCPLLFILRLDCIYENPFLLCFPLWHCCLSTSITITVCYPCHFKNPQWNDNPLFGGQTDCYQTNSSRCCCRCRLGVIITVPPNTSVFISPLQNIYLGTLIQKLKGLLLNSECSPI